MIIKWLCPSILQQNGWSHVNFQSQRFLLLCDISLKFCSVMGLLTLCAGSGVRLCPMRLANWWPAPARLRWCQDAPDGLSPPALAPAYSYELVNNKGRLVKSDGIRGSAADNYGKCNILILHFSPLLATFAFKNAGLFLKVMLGSVSCGNLVTIILAKNTSSQILILILKVNKKGLFHNKFQIKKRKNF